MKFMIKTLVFGFLSLLLFACSDSSGNPSTDTAQPSDGPCAGLTGLD